MSIWPDILDTLEAEVALARTLARAQAHAVARQTGPAWEPSADPGPLPADLAGRARRIAAAQVEAVASLREAMGETAARLGQAAPARREARSVYLDVIG
ncbi:hypothetical protein [Specibacter cremeus]|uniref:hypothetical protein n=1 Tax=Specibacter cremeus TaxID=1629051 RepID=UPI000F7A2528|nr:hypothetical protein [Specibacter cremeus]